MRDATTLGHTLALLFALLTALANAFALTTQHIASTRPRDHSSSFRLAVFLLRQPLWLLGWLGLGASLVFQALALHFGPMSEVQPLLVSELIVTLVLRQWWLHQRIRRLAWIGAGLSVLGLGVFLVASSPRGRAFEPAGPTWRAAVLVSLGVSVVLVLVARRGSPLRRAGCLGAATGVLWALEATFIKATTNDIATSGYAGAVLRWPIYALLVGGVAGLLCEQAALHVGPLKVSQPLIVIVDPIVSVLLGLWLYDERLHSGVAAVVLATCGFLAMGAGVVVLTQNAPSTMLAETRQR